MVGNIHFQFRNFARERVCFAIVSFVFHIFIYQLFCTQACPEGMCTNGTQVPYEVPSLPTPTKVGHTTGVYDTYSFRIAMGVLLRPTRTNQWKCCETGPTVFRPYPRRLDHYKGSAFFTVIWRPLVLFRLGFESATSRTADRRSPNWANHAAVTLMNLVPSLILRRFLQPKLQQ